METTHTTTTTTTVAEMSAALSATGRAVVDFETPFGPSSLFVSTDTPHANFRVSFDVRPSFGPVFGKTVSVFGLEDEDEVETFLSDVVETVAGHLSAGERFATDAETA